MQTIFKDLGSALILILLSGIFFCTASSVVQAQNLLVEEGQAAVRVYNENLVKAKTRALDIAKRDLLTRSLSRFLDPKDIERVFPLLSKNLLDSPDQFIESIRIINESTPVDISTFFLTVEGKIFRSRMVSALKKLALPLKTESSFIRTLEFSTNDESIFWQAPDRDLVLKQLRDNFAPYQVSLQPVHTRVPEQTTFLSDPFATEPSSMEPSSMEPFITGQLSGESFSGFGESFSGLSDNVSINKSEPAPPASEFPQIELTFTTHPRWSADFHSFPVTVGLRLKLYHPQTKTLLSSIYVQQRFQRGSVLDISQTLFNKLILKWSPLFHALAALDQREGVLSKIKLTGISSFQEEEYVMKRLFMNNSQWENLSLSTLSAQSVVYEGKYSGHKEDAVATLLQFNDLNNASNDEPYFRLNYVGWQNGTLLVHVQWVPRYGELKPYEPSFELKQQLLQAQKAEGALPLPTPILQVPLAPSKTTYVLPQSTNTYDHIKTRGDSTLYKVDIPSGTRFLSIQWYRVGNTNLRPKLTLYDQKRMPQREYRMAQRKILSTRYRIPSGRTREKSHIFIGVSDELGYVEDVVGGYQSFGYILRVGEAPEVSPTAIPEL